jgi:hypothetical protein
VTTDPLRRLTARLSELLGDEDGGLVLASLQKLRVLSAMGERARRRWPFEVSFERRAVGPWDADGARRPLAQARYWAADQRIPPKGERQRVVLVGESVARGYLFDPRLSFADVLRQLAPDVEVVDLACTNLTAPGLHDVLAAVPGLRPDAVVVFAGNNWDNIPLGLAELDRCAAELRLAGFGAVRQVFHEELLVPHARAVTGALGVLREALAVPLAVMVPETNLVDWRPERSVRTAVLPDDRQAEWLELYESGPDEAAARRMVELDGGVSPASQYLLGTILRRAGDLAPARAALEAARDAFCGLLVPHPPRCPSAVQSLLRDACREHDLRLVDLPAVFERHTGDLPGRRMFLDYCHLTLEGMRVAAAAALTALDIPCPGTVEVEPGVRATAHLLAALHSAHYGQAGELARHHCQVALDRHPPIAAVMADLARAQSSRWPSWTTSAFARVCQDPLARRYLIPEHPNQLAKTADHDLVRALTGSIPEPVTDRRVDLTDARFHAVTFQEHVGLRMGQDVPAFYRSHRPTSAFHLVCARRRTWRLRITARVPGLAGGDARRAELTVNGEPLGTLTVTGRWAVTQLDAALRQGVNVLKIEWPAALPPAAGVFERGARRLERGGLPDVLPVFGEVHSFTAAPGAALDKALDNAPVTPRPYGAQP